MNSIITITVVFKDKETEVTKEINVIRIETIDN